jgi:hypothetical protein
MRRPVLAAILLSGAALAGNTEMMHPHFDGKRVLPWYTELAKAKAAAKKQNKIVFIEYGREA